MLDITRNYIRGAPELIIAGAMLAVMVLLSTTLDLPIIYPSGGEAAFVGVHYIYPLIGVACLAAATLSFGDRETALRLLMALPCYAIVLFVHFNIKLWVPHIRHVQFDDLYWNMDQAFRPVVDACLFIRRCASGIIPYGANFYMVSFIALFYGSFLYHAIRTPAVFPRLLMAALVLQALGTFSYLIAPAIGPFVYEDGANPLITAGQHGMLAFYRSSVTYGPAYLTQHGSANFTAGLAAMPSLHSASAYLFFLFAWKHGRHGTTSHGRGEYVNLEDRSIHSNTVEGYFSIFKRGMKGVYQFCGENHLHRYLAEFEFRYNNRIAHGIGDTERADRLLTGIVGKRLTYQTSCGEA